MTKREAEIDELLGAWDLRLRRADDNLLALEGEPTYQMLAGGARASLDGATRARVEPALAALADLFEHRSRLTEVLERAKEIRRTFSSIWGNDEKVAAIEQLLCGPSIALGSRPTPLAQRTLLDPAAVDVAIVPEELLAAMGEAFETARDAVLAVTQAWIRLTPRIEEAEHEVALLRRKAESLGDAVQVDGDLVTLERELAVVRARVARDPLGATGAIDSALAPGIAAVRARIDLQTKARAKVTEMLGHAALVRRAIDDAQRRAEAARAQALEDFTPAFLGAHVARSLVEGLDVWLAKIEGTARAGRWGSAEVGLARWLEAAEGYVAAERAIEEAASALGLRLMELRGRLSARRAQLSARGAVNPALEALAREADEALRERPISLEGATARVEAFEAKMREASMGNRNR